jgi:hypothetical protein
MIVRIAVLFAMVSLVSACLGKATYRWKEEVLLHDGRVIVIERSVRTGEVPVEIGQPPGESDYTLAFKTPDGMRVAWESGKSFRPMILDFVDGVPYVVALGRTVVDYRAHGCPRPPYFFFRHHSGSWERISYERFPKQLRVRNLVSGATSSAVLVARDAVRSGFVSVEVVKRSQSGIVADYREVRESAWNPCAHRGDDFKYEPKN